MEPTRVRSGVRVLAVVAITAAVSARDAAGAQTVVELNAGPVFTASRGASSDIVAGGEVRLARILSPDRPASPAVLVRYSFGPYEPDRWMGVYPPEVPRPQLGNPGDGRAQFVEAGLGIRTSGGGRAVAPFVDLEAGVAAILYESGEVTGQNGSLYAAFRGGGVWRGLEWADAVLALGLRVYPGVQHIEAHLSLGLRRAL